jgi:signal transduction histidine kinase/ActR/RegA family two-component response regulator
MRIPAKYVIVYGFTGLILVFAMLLIVSSSLTTRAVLSRHATTIMENIASYTIDKAQSYLEPARKAARLTQRLSQSGIVSSKKSATMAAYFNEQLTLNPQFSGIYFGSTDGEFTMVSRYNKLAKGGFLAKYVTFPNGKRRVEKTYTAANGNMLYREFDALDDYDPRKRPWFKQAANEKGLIWTKPYIFFTSQKPGITTASPVYRGNEFLGVVGVDIQIDELSTFISKLQVSANGRAFILSQHGTIIAYPDVSKIRQSDHGEKVRLSRINELDDPVAREAFLSLGVSRDQLFLEKPVFTSFKMNGERYNAMFAPFSDKQWPWVICIYMPEDDYLGAIKSNRTLNILIAMVAVAMAFAIGLVVARKLNAAREMAETADRAKSHFLARMSHEIRTPMNAILGAGELLSETPLNGDQKRYVAILQNAGEHLRELVSDVLDLSRFEAGEFKLYRTAFNLRTTVEKTCEVFALESMDKGVLLDCSMESDVPEHLLGDPTALKQVLVNLLSNAMKFTAEGSISLSVRTVSGRTSDKGENVVLEFSVADTGIGIPQDMHRAIFERFTQADGSSSRQYGGTGLGLAISRNLVAAMGGDIRVESTPGEGATFIFTARLLVNPDPETEDAAGPAPLPGPDKALRIKRILMVEDDERNRLLFTLFLKDIPHTLDTAESGEQALAMHTEKPYDLVLMDIEMPGMDGYQTTEAIRAWEAETGALETPIVAVTAHALTEAKLRCRESGCTGYLPKPVTKTMLRRTVEDYLGTSLDPDKGAG